jgi:hypothetical protein
VSQFDSIRFQPSRPLLKEVSADRLNAILSEIKKNRPRGERGIVVRQAGDATYIGLAASLGKGGSGVGSQPWDLLPSQDSGGQYLVTVLPGTLNGILPSNWSEKFKCDATGLYFAKALIATDGEQIAKVSIAVDQNEPKIQTPQKFGLESSIEYLFGMFSQGQVYRVVGDGHITLTPEVWLTMPKEQPANPGELPYIQFYALS